MDSMVFFSGLAEGAKVDVDLKARELRISCADPLWLSDQRRIATGDERVLTIADANRRKLHELLDEFLDHMRSG